MPARVRGSAVSTRASLAGLAGVTAAPAARLVPPALSVCRARVTRGERGGCGGARRTAATRCSVWMGVPRARARRMEAVLFPAGGVPKVDV